MQDTTSEALTLQTGSRSGLPSSSPVAVAENHRASRPTPRCAYCAGSVPTGRYGRQLNGHMPRSDSGLLPDTAGRPFVRRTRARGTPRWCRWDSSALQECRTDGASRSLRTPGSPHPRRRPRRGSPAQRADAVLECLGCSWLPGLCDPSGEPGTEGPNGSPPDGTVTALHGIDAIAGAYVRRGGRQTWRH